MLWLVAGGWCLFLVFGFGWLWGCVGGGVLCLVVVVVVVGVGVGVGLVVFLLVGGVFGCFCVVFCVVLFFFFFWVVWGFVCLGVFVVCVFGVVGGVVV
ncbi:hypothetical protein ACTHTR_11145, partial [Neisseria sp. P0018.S004]